MSQQLSLFYGTEPAAHATTKKQLPTPQATVLTIFIDGAARGNPGPAGAGIVISHHHKPVIEKGFYLGEKTNNQAEYTALICALMLAQDFCTKHHIHGQQYEIFSDSELLVKQIKGMYSVKNAALIQLKKRADTLLHNTTYTITHVVREKNKIADKLANLGIDKKVKLPAMLKKMITEN